MRFLHFSTASGPGGAGRAAFRLHAALRDAGHASRMLVRDRETGDPDLEVVSVNPLISQLRRLQKHVPFVRPPRAAFTFNYDQTSGVRSRRALASIRQTPDAVCLHWVSGLLTAKAIRAIADRFRCPLLWVVMDQEPMTGGCHYSFGCQRYESGCGHCPLLARPWANDVSRQVFLRKQRYLTELPIVFVAPTSWVEERTRRSALFGSHRVERIPLAIDTTVFHNAQRAAARQQLGIPHDRPVIFFGSSYLHEPRKGMPALVEAFQRLCQRQPRAVAAHGSRGVENVFLLMAGRHGDELKRQLPFPVLDLGYLGDERQLATAYRAADVFACSSIEDAGPMMIPEAMLCGTPVVAFNTGGAPDLISDGQTGYLARLGDSADLAHGLQQVLGSPSRAAMGETAALAARRLHEPKCVAERYTKLVLELTESVRAAAVPNRGVAA